MHGLNGNTTVFLPIYDFLLIKYYPSVLDKGSRGGTVYLVNTDVRFGTLHLFKYCTYSSFVTLGISVFAQK